MSVFRNCYFIVVLLICGLLFSLAGACGDDDDDDDVLDDDDGDDDDIGDDDDDGDDDAADDDAADDDAADDDAADDDAADDDAADDDAADDDTTDEAQMIVNGGFETGDIAPWVGEWGGGIVYSDEEIYVHDGTYAVWLGGRKDVVEWIGQLVTIPAGCDDATIRFWHRHYRVGTATGGLTVSVKNALNTIKLFDILEVPDTEYGFMGTWAECVYELSAADLAAIDGDQVVLHFELESTGGGLMANLNTLIDDVTFTVWY